MRFIRYSIAAALFALGISSCASVPPPYIGSKHGEPTTVAIWIDPHSGLPPEETLAGCNLWNEKDVRCVLARNALEADVSIVADNHPCAPFKDGSTPVAFASPSRVISFRVDCYYDTGRASGFDSAMYHATVAHEIGHELGIWDHVPLKCDDKIKEVAPDGTRRCGVAIMNPMYDPEVQHITKVDAFAFDIRSRDYTVVPVKTVEGEDPHICIMYAPSR